MASAEFNVVEKTLIITLTKELDHHSAIYIKDKSDKIMRERNIKNIVMNFEKITFMDSSGIGVIMGRYKKILYLKGIMVAVNMSPTVKRIYNISGLHKIMRDCKNMKEAMNLITENN